MARPGSSGFSTTVRQTCTGPPDLRPAIEGVESGWGESNPGQTASCVWDHAFPLLNQNPGGRRWFLALTRCHGDHLDGKCLRGGISGRRHLNGKRTGSHPPCSGSTGDYPGRRQGYAFREITRQKGPCVRGRAAPADRKLRSGNRPTGEE